MGARSRRTSKRETSTSSDTTIEDDTSAGGYEVEAVVGKKFDENGNIFYHLKWKNWIGEPTWEPEENCLCPKLISDYEKKVARKGRVVNIQSIEVITAAEALINSRAKGPRKMLTSKGASRTRIVPSPDSSHGSTPPRVTRDRLKHI